MSLIFHERCRIERAADQPVLLADPLCAGA